MLISFIASIIGIVGFFGLTNIKQIIPKHIKQETSTLAQQIDPDTEFMGSEDTQFSESTEGKIISLESLNQPLTGYVTKPSSEYLTREEALTFFSSDHHWDFNSGDLRGLTEENVILKKGDKSHGFYLDFYDLCSDSCLTLDQKLSIPWRLSFSANHNNMDYLEHTTHMLNITFSTGNSSFRIIVNVFSFHFYEDGVLRFSHPWQYNDIWVDWDIKCSSEGKLSIEIDKKPYFSYFFRKFNYKQPTEINFTSPKKYNFHLDNLKVN